MKAAGARAILLLAIVYTIIGLWLGALAGQAGTHQGLVAWRGARSIRLIRSIRSMRLPCD